MLNRGDDAAPFELTGLNGKPHTLSDLLTVGPVLLAFFKISCPTCQFTLPFLERLHQSESAGTPRVFAISQDNRAATLEFHEQFGITMPTLLDKQSDNYPASNAYAISSVPSIFLVDSNGRLAAAMNGFDRAGLDSVAKLFGRPLFRSNERVPEMRPG